MYTISLNNNIIPHTWKLANIIPIPKSNKDMKIDTLYRPISLLSVIANTGGDPTTIQNASCSQVMFTRILALLPSSHVPCDLVTSQVVGWAICTIVFQVGFIRSVLVFKTQRSTIKLRTGHATLAVPHPLHQYRNRFHNQVQLKLPMGIPSPFYNSMQWHRQQTGWTRWILRAI